MKPVKELIIGKSGEETIRFNPTGHQIIFAIEKAKSPGDSDQDIAERCGMKRDNPSNWARKYGQLYLEWLEEFIEASHFSKQAEVLESVGMVHATQGNFSYWKEMARKHGVIQDEVREQTININTDFTAILMGSNPEAARDAILQEVMGIKKSEPIAIEAIPVEQKAPVKAKKKAIEKSGK